ncbi:MAG TPA: hypothetical protein VKD72_22945, partial [Gemmataceae bacterium]|nr:hypothetical protein [Gemmataceae bacterium]
MSGAWTVVLVFATGMAALFWCVWAWAVSHLQARRRQGTEPTQVQVEARDWPAAIALGFTGLAVAVWLAG